MGKDNYEISIWRDTLVNGHYEETKIAIIGSNKFQASCRAFEPKLVENVNGTNTFTFKMYYKCRDITLQDVYTILADSSSQDLEDINNLLLVFHQLEGIAADGYDNPFIQYLTNETKIKVKWKNQWYDLIIKNCQEDSSGKSITYTCSDAYINELSKNGFGLVFDNELGNNQGTAQELGAKILEGSDWTIDPNNQDIIQQEVEEAVYSVAVSQAVSCTKDANGSAFTIPSGSTILLFYQQIIDLIDSGQNSGTKSFQMAYAPTYTTEVNGQVVTNAPSYTTTSNYMWVYYPTLQVFSISALGIRIAIYSAVSPTYRAKRLARTQKVVYDPITKRNCYVYSASGLSGHEIYQYTDTESIDAVAVVNLLANSSNFIDTNGWEGNYEIKSYPKLSSVTDLSTYNGKSYLKITRTTPNTNYNSGLKSCGSYLPDGLQKGTEYIFRYKSRTNADGEPSSTYAAGSSITVEIGTYTVDANNIKYFNTSIANVGTAVSESSDWYHRVVTFNSSYTRAEIYNQQIGIFIKLRDDLNVRWLEEAQFFKKIPTNDSLGFVLPGSFATTTLANERYNYYDHTAQATLADAKDIKFIYQGYTPYSGTSPVLTPVYNTNFEKIRSIEGKQSNRFNLLQSVAEEFNCWVRFRVEHNPVTGAIIYNQDGTPQKYVIFKKEIGEEVGIGFIYGIDLKSIQRTIESTNIVTKTIVSPNNNEFATNGSCNIARAASNYSKSNNIYNLDYYINKGLLDGTAVTQDLYNKGEGYLGYYSNLHDYYTSYDNNSQALIKLEEEKLKLNSYKTIFEDTITSANELITSYKAQICSLAGLSESSSLSDATDYIKNHANADQVRALVESWKSTEATAANASAELASCTLRLASIEVSITSIKSALDATMTLIENLELAFNTKYARFIQEGTWQSDDYIDDNLYYIDALSLAYRSARPQISYNISVLRLSGLEDFKNKVFHLGDITYIQDKEFFGTTLINNVETPIKEKVLVSEITSNFDEPDKDSFKVQNYKTAFDDLFQRVTAATQSLQFAEGEYARAADAITSDGSIKAEVLQNAFDSNKELVMSATNDTVVQDSNGLTLSSVEDASRKVRINSNGIFISTDGGATWKNAVRGSGVATEALTAGSINTNEIMMYQGTSPTFRWDFNGISAYDSIQLRTGGPLVVNSNKFVRYDKYGIYGIELSGSSLTDWVPINESDIWNNAKFGMTWKGFFVKNKTGSGMVEVSSENDVRVVQKINGADIERIKLGNIGTSASPLYGLKINDQTGAAVLEAKSDGTLWIEKLLSIGNGSTSMVSLGYGSTTRSGTNYHEIINANNKFIVYEDGHLVAKSGYIGNGSNGFEIGDTYIRNGVESMTDGNHNGIYLGTDGIRLGPNFYVDKTGNVTANTLRTISSVTISYGVSDSINTYPSTWVPSITSLVVQDGQYIWTKTQTIYTYGADDIVYQASRAGKDGTSVSIKGNVATYHDLPTSGMQDGDGYIVDNASDAPDIGTRPVIGVLYTYSASTSSWVYCGQIKGEDGTNSATVILYKRAATTPTTPSEQFTYTFATHTLTGNLEGWSTTIPINDGNPCYSIQVFLSTKTATATITTESWSLPVVYTQNGAKGDSTFIVEVVNSLVLPPATYDGTVPWNDTEWQANSKHYVHAYIGGTRLTIDGVITSGQSPQPTGTYIKLTVSQSSSRATLIGLNYSLTDTNKTLETYVTGFNYQSGTSDPTFDSGKITYDLYYNGVLVATDVFDILKNKAGNPGTPAPDYYRVETEPNVVARDKNGAYKQNSLSFKTKKNGAQISGTETVKYKIWQNGLSANYYEVTTTSVTLTYGSTYTGIGTFEPTTSVNVEIYSGSTLLDAEMVQVINDGADGTSVSIKGNYATFSELQNVSSPQDGDGYTINNANDDPRRASYPSTIGILYVYRYTVSSDWYDSWIYCGQIKGQDATQYYIHYVYNDSNTVSENYSTTETRKYIGTYVDTTAADAATFAVAQAAGAIWSKITGTDGTPGTHTATVFLYQRYSASSLPPKPTTQLTYTFGTGELSGDLGNWSQTIPEDNGLPCYKIQASAISTSASYGIPSSAWSDQVIYVKDGDDGNSTESITVYYTTAPVLPATHPTRPDRPSGAPQTTAVVNQWTTVPYSPTSTYPYQYRSIGTKTTIVSPASVNYSYGDVELCAVYDKSSNYALQYDAFLKLTQNGTIQTIARDDVTGNLYINASYINTGILQVGDYNAQGGSTGRFLADIRDKNVRIGGFYVNNSAIYNKRSYDAGDIMYDFYMTAPDAMNNYSSYSGLISGQDYVYVGPDGIGVLKLKVTTTEPTTTIEKQTYMKAGELFSNAGTIGEWNITSDGLSKGTFGAISSAWLTPNGKSGASIGGSSSDVSFILTCGANFGVTTDGSVYANIMRFGQFAEMETTGLITAYHGSKWSAIGEDSTYIELSGYAESTVSGKVEIFSGTGGIKLKAPDNGSINEYGSAIAFHTGVVAFAPYSGGSAGAPTIKTSTWVKRVTVLNQSPWTTIHVELKNRYTYIRSYLIYYKVGSVSRSITVSVPANATAGEVIAGTAPISEWGFTTDQLVSGYGNWAEDPGNLCAVLEGNWYGVSGTIITSSRLNKHDILPFSSRYDVLFDNLKPCSFVYKAGERRHYGMILDELREAMNIANISTEECAAYCLVDKENPDGDGGIRYDEFISLNTWQIQLLKQRINSLEERLAKLEH